MPVLGPINEHSSAQVSFTMAKPNGVAVALGDLLALTLTLYDKTTRAVINARDGQNILNANDVTVDSAGLVTWAMQPADNAITNQARTTLETHVALFYFAWANGHHHHDQEITVRNLTRVP